MPSPRGGGAGPYEEFGAALAVDGGTLVVGAPDSVMGAAHVFERRGKAWFELQRLEQGSPFGHDRFGAALALEDDTLLVGAPFETGVAAIDSGVVYAYERDSSGWQPTDRLLPGDANPLGNFGWDLAVSGDDAILGARHESPAGVFSGSAYLFHRAGIAWSEVTKIVPSDGRPSDGFGAAVSLSGDVALVGAPMVTFGGTPQSTPDELISGSGAVYAWSISSGHCPPLYAAPRTISLAAGGTQFFTLRAGAEHGGRMYLLLGSTSGTSPGFSFGDVVLPLNVDAYFTRTLRHPNFPPYTASQGFLDGEGVAEARFALPPGLDPSFVGTTLHHAYGVIDPASWRVLLVSDPDPLLLAP